MVSQQQICREWKNVNNVESPFASIDYCAFLNTPERKRQ